MLNIRIFLTSLLVRIFVRFVVIWIDPRFSAFREGGGRWRRHILFSIRLQSLTLRPRCFTGLGNLLGGRGRSRVLVRGDPSLPVFNEGTLQLFVLVFYLNGHLNYCVNATDDSLRRSLSCGALWVLRWLLFRCTLVFYWAGRVCDCLRLGLNSTGRRLSGGFPGCRSPLAVRDQDSVLLTTFRGGLIGRRRTYLR